MKNKLFWINVVFIIATTEVNFSSQTNDLNNSTLDTYKINLIPGENSQIMQSMPLTLYDSTKYLELI
ncbi:hypothetical protein [Candidatus Epulonipiscium viviparus]|uniref:hypothetical protein n=1 Tax=Candidatus Epulonipiscium viviparus TaxID=420336 RepID=UPI00273812BF|nr:hypothetical protein [Candidatus Epulopiscium viviparus]